jgi:hypothetical protein
VLGDGDTCDVDPLFDNEVPPTLSSEAQFDSVDFTLSGSVRLSSSSFSLFFRLREERGREEESRGEERDYSYFSSQSPAIGTGAALPGLTTDFLGNPRANPPSKGALEFGSEFDLSFYFTPNTAFNPPLVADPVLPAPSNRPYPIKKREKERKRERKKKKKKDFETR